MVENRKLLKKYIECDLRSFGLYPLSLEKRFGGVLCPKRWKLQIKLRKLELFINTHKYGRLNKLLVALKYQEFERYCLKLGCDIPANVFGPGLCINHTEGIVVNGNSRIGSNCRINAGVNIGSFSKFDKNFSDDNAPIIGNNVYIGPGAKIFGKIKIGDNVAIGANAVVFFDVPDNSTVVGIPGRIILNKGSFNMIKYGDESFNPFNDI